MNGMDWTPSLTGRITLYVTREILRAGHKWPVDLGMFTTYLSAKLKSTTHQSAHPPSLILSTLLHGTFIMAETTAIEERPNPIHLPILDTAQAENQFMKPFLE